MRKWFRERYFDLVFWWCKHKLERLLDSELRPYGLGSRHEIFQDETQRKYSEGLAVIKNKIGTMAGNRNTQNYERVLGSVKELLELGTEETSSQRELRKIMTTMARLPEKSQRMMIQERIGHYEELRKYKEQRALIKEIKQARKIGEEELAQELEDKWRKDYGQTRNPRRR